MTTATIMVHIERSPEYITYSSENIRIPETMVKLKLHLRGTPEELEPLAIKLEQFLKENGL